MDASQSEPTEVDENDEVVLKRLVDYFLSSKNQELEEMLLKQDTDKHYGIQLHLGMLAQVLPSVTAALLQRPLHMLRLLDAALLTAQDRILAVHAQAGRMAFKERMHCRIQGAPYFLDAAEPRLNPAIDSVRSVHVGRLLTLSGCVVRVGEVLVMESHRLFQCKRCKHEFLLHVDLATDGGVDLPARCPSRANPSCSGAEFEALQRCQMLTNVQDVHLQDRSSSGERGAGGCGMEKGLRVVLADELVGSCRPGSLVEVCGVVQMALAGCSGGQRCSATLLLKACGVTLLPRKLPAALSALRAAPEAVFLAFWAAHAGAPMQARNRILEAVCPQIGGLACVKLAVLLLLIGGVPRRDPESSARIRGQIHCLLVGDPGTAKSQFLKYAALVSPHAIMTAGRSSSGAGLTATAVKDAGQWALQAGALVLADGGVCCIDEFATMKEDDRRAVHEAMEQQTLSIAKAGLMTSMQTRTSVLAATNPRGRTYDAQASVSDNTGIAAPLLSRFDIILILMDTMDPAWDRAVSRHILDQHLHPAHPPRQPDPAPPPDASAPPLQWTVSLLRAYIAWVQSSFQPSLTDAAESVLVRYFAQQRRSQQRSSGRSSARGLECMVRLAQAHARLMARSWVSQDDAVVAVLLMEASVHTSSLLGSRNALHGGFSSRADEDWAAVRARVLAALALDAPETAARLPELTRDDSS